MVNQANRRPRTLSQWQEAANLASFWLNVADLNRYGLLAGGPAVNEAECERILNAAARRGIRPVETVEGDHGG